MRSLWLVVLLAIGCRGEEQKAEPETVTRRGLASLPLTAELPATAEVELLPARFARHPTVIITAEALGARAGGDPVTISVVHDESEVCELVKAIASFEGGPDGELVGPPERRELAHGFVITGAFRRSGADPHSRVDHCDEDVRAYCSAARLATSAQVDAVKELCASIRPAQR